MAKPKYPEQARELSRILEESGLTILELATMTKTDPDTVRIYKGGYSPCSIALMQSFHLAAKLHMAMRQTAAPSVYPELQSVMIELRETEARLKDIRERIEKSQPVNYSKIEQVAEECERTVLGSGDVQPSEPAPPPKRRSPRTKGPRSSP